MRRSAAAMSQPPDHHRPTGARRPEPQVSPTTATATSRAICGARSRARWGCPRRCSIGRSSASRRRAASSTTAIARCPSSSRPSRAACSPPAACRAVFPTISLGEVFLTPTAMMFRNLMAMDVEEMIRAQPMDAVVLDRRLRQDGAGAADGRVVGGPARRFSSSPDRCSPGAITASASARAPTAAASGRSIAPARSTRRRSPTSRSASPSPPAPAA